MPEFDIWNWPLVDGGWRAAPVVVGTAALATYAGRVADSLAMGLITAGVLVLSTWRFWLPVRYHVRSRGIVENCLGRRRLIPWQAIRHCHLRKRGVVLRFRKPDQWIDVDGIRYLEGRNQRGQLAECIHYYRQPDAPLG
jgi:hypothetical protein